MPGDFTNCGCCVQERRTKPATEIERLIAEIERIKAAPPDKPKGPPRDSSKVPQVARGRFLRRSC